MSGEDFENSISSHPNDQAELFVRLLIEHEPLVRSFLRGLLPSWNDVDEVIQEASLIAWRKFGEFEQGTAFGGWLLTIARFEALKYRRKIARTPNMFSDDVWDLLADEAIKVELPQARRHHLEVCLQRLKPVQRELLMKVHAPGAVIKEIALQSEKSEQAFYKVVQRLRASLLDCVTKAIAKENA